MKAIVHIGTEKTGTTSIQNYLFKNRALLSKAGYHFLQSAGEKNSRALPAYCMLEEKYDDFFDDKGVDTLEKKHEFKKDFLQRFNKELTTLPAGIHTVIISSEHFHSRLRREEEIENLHNLLSGYFDSIRIVCYFREQSSTCESYYSTQLKSGGARQFSEFVHQCRPGNYYYNYFDIAKNWERYFGFEALDLSIFDKKHFLNGDLLDDFSASIDPALVGSLNTNVKMENESLTPAGQALTLALNKAFPRKNTRAEVWEVRERLKKKISQSCAGAGQKITPHERERIFNSFSESNEMLRARFFANYEKLFDLRLVSNQLIEPIADDEFIEELVHLLSGLRKMGKKLLPPDEYSAVCSRLFASIGESIKQGGERSEEDKLLWLFTEEARFVTQEAQRIRNLEIDSTAKLRRLARRLDPLVRGLDSKLEHYRNRYVLQDSDEVEGFDVTTKIESRALNAPIKPRKWPSSGEAKIESAPKESERSLYLLLYESGEEELSEADKAQVQEDFGMWMSSLKGSIKGFTKNAGFIRADQLHSDKDSYAQPFALTIILETETDGEARTVARKFPYLDYGGSIQVLEIFIR